MDFSADLDLDLIREGVRAVCSKFDDDYWAARDQRHEFPWDFYRALAEGGVGTICGMGNVAPELVQAMFRPNPPVEQMQAACGLVSGPFIALLKAMLAAQTDQPGWLNVRAPWRPATLTDGARRLAQLDGLTRQSAG